MREAYRIGLALLTLASTACLQPRPAVEVSSSCNNGVSVLAVRVRNVDQSRGPYGIGVRRTGIGPDVYTGQISLSQIDLTILQDGYIDPSGNQLRIAGQHSYRATLFRDFGTSRLPLAAGITQTVPCS